MVSAQKILLVAVVLGAGASASFADQTVVNKPQFKGYALDWCLTWATDCGKPAADKYCQTGGYEKSVNFTKWESPGKPTRLVGSNQVCDEPGCSSFTSITCTKPDAVDNSNDDEEVVTYNKPMAGSRRLDWCLTWATDCGQPAADYFCKKQGQNNATAFKIAENIGKTRILKTNEKCTDPQCDGFKYITCE